MKQNIPFYGPLEKTVQEWTQTDHNALHTHRIASNFYSFIEQHRPHVSVVGVDEAVLEQRVIEKIANKYDRPSIIAVMENISEPLITVSYTHLTLPTICSV